MSGNCSNTLADLWQSLQVALSDVVGDVIVGLPGITGREDDGKHGRNLGQQFVLLGLVFQDLNFFLSVNKN